MPNVKVEVETEIKRSKYEILIGSKQVPIDDNGVGNRVCAPGKHALFWRMRGKGGDSLKIRLSQATREILPKFESKIPEGEILGFGVSEFLVEAE
jgi:hypothetical protein